jgi:putative ATP-dependent endonuclease of OLD family
LPFEFESISLKIKHYKCFGETEQGFDAIKPMNLIIGRNNSGKSTLLELVEFAISKNDISKYGHKGQVPEVILDDVLTEKVLRFPFQNNTTGGTIGGNHWEFGKSWIGKKFKWKMHPGRRNEVVEIDPPFGLPDSKHYIEKLENAIVNPFQGKSYKRLFAERSVIPEKDAGGPNLESTGNGLTNTIQCFVNKEAFPSDLVEKTLLNEMNKIFHPDVDFKRIVVQQSGNGEWEIFLEEVSKGRIRLSHSGSGIKTVLLVLAYIHLVPFYENKPLSNYIFAFEELENNLHPALQRRLIDYLRTIAEKEKAIFFLTTHSSAAIDMLSTDPLSQVLHVKHDNQVASISTAITYMKRKGALDDLDIRASDLLQSNGIGWLEGPSDRLYFNKWVECFTHGKLKEGIHYQCVFYGGRLLSHLSANPTPKEENELINILLVNRNIILVMDSDKKEETDTINSTKERAIKEVSNSEGFAWLTDGREIENYLPIAGLRSISMNKSIPEIGQYEEIEQYLHSHIFDFYSVLKKSKMLFAEAIVPHIDKAGLESVNGLKGKIEKAISQIKKWNQIA